MQERLASERQADSATDALRQPHFATPKVHGPVSGHASRSQLEQEQEAEMWRDYGMNGADLVGGMDTESSEARLYERLQEEAATFGILDVNSGPCDNPMGSEISSHIGGQGNCFCRKCTIGGTRKDKATDEGYHALFEVF